MSVVKLEVKIISVDEELYETSNFLALKSEFLTLEELIKMASDNEAVEPLEVRLNNLVHKLVKEL